MIIKEQLLLALKDKPKTNKELKEILGKNTRIISATVSNNQHLFIRLEKGLVGLRNKDEDKITGNRIRNPYFPLYKKMVNALADGTKTVKQLRELMPDEKRVSISATVSMRPDLFIRIKDGLIGRTGRDEWLKKREEEKKNGNMPQ